eukprot:jgi/Psemu1/5058/gm1.5058_g
MNGVHLHARLTGEAPEDELDEYTDDKMDHYSNVLNRESIVQHFEMKDHCRQETLRQLMSAVTDKAMNTHNVASPCTCAMTKWQQALPRSEPGKIGTMAKLSSFGDGSSSIRSNTQLGVHPYFNVAPPDNQDEQPPDQDSSVQLMVKEKLHSLIKKGYAERCGLDQLEAREPKPERCTVYCYYIDSSQYLWELELMGLGDAPYPRREPFSKKYCI